jgi:putative restriction endonuclease
MPEYADLVQPLLNAFDESGAPAVLLSSRSQRHPRQFVTQIGGEVVEIWVYIWTLTHGGGIKRPANEYRIQLTGISQPPLQQNPTGGPTLLLGYEPTLNCFAGFDLRKHQEFSTKSPSIQIPFPILQAAVQDGFAFATKGNNEIAIGFRPDQFLAYALNANLLHDQGVDAKTVALLSRAASNQIVSAEAMNEIPAERQRIVSKVARLSRDARFRPSVINAYNHTCAVTGIQLRLVEAAHILPVGAAASTDQTTNGLCLSLTFHRAYDRSLIYLDDSYVMRINSLQEEELVREGFAGGIEQFRAQLGKRIYLPSNRDEWPSLDMIRQANQFREIPA